MWSKQHNSLLLYLYTHACYCIPFCLYALGKREKKISYSYIKIIRFYCNFDSWFLILKLLPSSSSAQQKLFLFEVHSIQSNTPSIHLPKLKKKMYPYLCTCCTRMHYLYFPSSLTFVLSLLCLLYLLLVFQF